MSNPEFHVIAFPSGRELLRRLPSLLVGLVFLGAVEAVGIGLYIGASLGTGPRDGLMTGIANRGYPVWRVRTALELVVLGIGVMLGGDVGVGTALFAFGIGPLSQVFLRVFHMPIPPGELGPGVAGE
jgi:uncharacterized membrane protein YczE